MTDIVDRIDAVLAEYEVAKTDIEDGRDWALIDNRPAERFAELAAERAVLREINRPAPDRGRIRRLIRATAGWFR